MALRAVSPIGASDPLQWGAFSMSASQTSPTTNATVRFDTVMGGNLGISAYAISLPADRTFRLTAGVYAGFTGSTGRIIFRWYDATAGAYTGISGYYLADTHTGNGGEQTTAYAILTPTVNTSVQVRLESATAIQSIGGASTWCEVMEIR